MTTKHEHTIDENGIEWCPATAEHETPETITVTLNRADANRIFQAMAVEQGRINTADVEQDCIDHARDLAEKSRQWLLTLTEPIEGTDL